MTAIILAGGKSSRMGYDKAFAELGGAPLIEKQVDLLRGIFKKIIIVTNTPEKYKLSKVKTVKDIIPGFGPLSGIYSGLIASRSLHNFIVACDMPFINTGLIEYMHKKAAGYDVVIPKVKNKYEPLFCIYSQSCLKYIKALFEKKSLRIISFFPQVKVKKITAREISRFSRPEKIFVNINTPWDLRKISL